MESANLGGSIARNLNNDTKYCHGAFKLSKFNLKVTLM